MYNAMQGVDGAVSGLSAALTALNDIQEERLARLSHESAIDGYLASRAREKAAVHKMVRAVETAGRATNLAQQLSEENRRLRAQLAGRN